MHPKVSDARHCGRGGTYIYQEVIWVYVDERDIYFGEYLCRFRMGLKGQLM